MSNKELMRLIPAVEELLTVLQHDFRFDEFHHDVRVRLLRRATQEVRQDLIKAKQEGDFHSSETVSRRIVELAAKESELMLQPHLRKVVNATG
jgi:hypothetical protein